MTGIELGPDSCVLVRPAAHSAVPSVQAAHVFPSIGSGASAHETFADALRRARKRDGLSSLARVVAWGVPDAQGDLDLDRLPEIAPLLAAGFEIESIVSPVHALTDLVNARAIDTSTTAVAAVSLNRHGVAMTVVSRGVAIASRVFEWPLGRPFEGRHPDLLDRYLVISQVAPQLQHMIELVRPVYGANVSSVVVCGNLPDLRSLSMLLIDEIDVEIDTLDSPDLLESADALPGEMVPSLQLACVVCGVPREEPLSLPDDYDSDGVSAGSDDAARAVVSGPTFQGGTTSSVQRTAIALALVLAGAWLFLGAAAASPASPLFPDGLTVATSVPPATTLKPEATMGRVPEEEPAVTVSSVPEKPPAIAREEPPAPPLLTPVAAIDRSMPLPRVDGIMISSQRRLAIVDGDVVAPGAAVGDRIVARIESDGIVLREPSGREVHVAIRARR